MSTPIYQLFVINNNVTMWQAYNALSEAQKKDLNEKQVASFKAVGAQQIAYCFSAWADEQHPYWGLHRFPSLEARIKHTQTLQEIGWLEGMDAFTLLGTSEDEPQAVTIPNPIYKLWINRSNPAGERRFSELSKDELATAMEKHNSIYQQNGSRVIIQCNSYWCNETYPSFGISVYPGVEANMKVMQGLEALGWRQAVDCLTLLGIPMPEGM
jgi:hypothetical protein